MEGEGLTLNAFLSECTFSFLVFHLLFVVSCFLLCNFLMYQRLTHVIHPFIHLFVHLIIDSLVFFYSPLIVPSRLREEKSNLKFLVKLRVETQLLQFHDYSYYVYFITTQFIKNPNCDAVSFGNTSMFSFSILQFDTFFPRSLSRYFIVKEIIG